MPRRLQFLLLLALALGAVALFSRLDNRRSPHAHASPPAQAGSIAVETGDRPVSVGRTAVEPDGEWIASAHRLMGSHAHETGCGPYRLLTDMDTGRFSGLCTAVVANLDAAYASLLRVQPAGPPRGMILVFSRHQDFRTYVSDQTGLPQGYAAFSRASRGIVAVANVDSLDLLSGTLTHEIAHLLHRRTFGNPLPPWLSEGLADAMGDTSTATGITRIEDLSGLKAFAARFLAAVETEEHRPLDDLFALSRSRFDQGIRTFDYEQSALLVRFLLLDPELGRRFQQLLQDIAAGTPYRANDVPDALGLPLATLEAKFETWLRVTFQPLQELSEGPWQAIRTRVPGQTISSPT